VIELTSSSTASLLTDKTACDKHNNPSNNPDLGMFILPELSN
jgi:hypothetical protein